MKSIIKSLLFILSGVLLAAGLLYGYTQFIKTSSQDTKSRELVEVNAGEALISHISGEIYLIRDEKIISPRAGDFIREGDVIKVVDESWCQIHFVGKATMKLKSNTLVRIQKLLSSSQEIDVRTELLTGSMMYKVDRLEITDNLEVIAQEKVYRVEGTEFMIEMDAEGSQVTVREGKVAVHHRDKTEKEQILEMVPAGYKLDLKGWDYLSELPDLRELNPEDKTMFEEESPVFIPQGGEALIYMDIQIKPEGAQLYLDGRLSGRGHMSGLFSPTDKLTILARKRGYKDKSLSIIPGESSSSTVIIMLEALGLEDSLQEEEEKAKEISAEALAAKYEQEMLDLRQKLEDSEAATKEILQEVRGLNQSLNSEKEDLEKALSNSLAEQEKLRNLITQIQSLTEDS